MPKFRRIANDMPRLPTRNRQDADFLRRVMQEHGMVSPENLWSVDKYEQKMQQRQPTYSNPTDQDIKEMLQMFTEMAIENLTDAVGSLKVVADSLGDLDPEGDSEQNVLALTENLRKIQEMLREEVQAILLRRTLKSVD